MLRVAEATPPVGLPPLQPAFLAGGEVPVIEIEQSFADEGAKDGEGPDEQVGAEQAAGGRVVVAAGEVELEIEEAEEIGEEAEERAVSADDLEGFGDVQPAGVSAFVGAGEIVFAEGTVGGQDRGTATFEAIPEIPVESEMVAKI